MIVNVCSVEKVALPNARTSVLVRDQMTRVVIFTAGREATCDGPHDLGICPESSILYPRGGFEASDHPDHSPVLTTCPRHMGRLTPRAVSTRVRVTQTPRVQEVDHPPVHGVHGEAGLPGVGIIRQVEAELLARPRAPPPPSVHVEDKVEEGEQEGEEGEHRGDVIAVDCG